MKNYLFSALFIASALVSTQAMAGNTNTDEVVIDPTDGKDPQETVKKSPSDKYNFTLFNFFSATTTSKTDTTSTIVTDPKKVNDDLDAKISL